MAHIASGFLTNKWYLGNLNLKVKAENTGKVYLLVRQRLISGKSNSLGLAIVIFTIRIY